MCSNNSTEIVNAINHSLAEFSGDALFEDDITFMVIKFKKIERVGS